MRMASLLKAAWLGPRRLGNPGKARVKRHDRTAGAIGRQIDSIVVIGSCKDREIRRPRSKAAAGRTHYSADELNGVRCIPSRRTTPLGMVGALRARVQADMSLCCGSPKQARIGVPSFHSTHHRELFAQALVSCLLIARMSIVRSAMAMVSGRWAMRTCVIPRSFNALAICFSFSRSRWLVASSRNRMRG